MGWLCFNFMLQKFEPSIKLAIINLLANLDCICDWILENPSSTHTTRRYTFHHHTIAVHTS